MNKRNFENSITRFWFAVLAFLILSPVIGDHDVEASETSIGGRLGIFCGDSVIGDRGEFNSANNETIFNYAIAECEELSRYGNRTAHLEMIFRSMKLQYLSGRWYIYHNQRDYLRKLGHFSVMYEEVAEKILPKKSNISKEFALHVEKIFRYEIDYIIDSRYIEDKRFIIFDILLKSWKDCGIDLSECKNFSYISNILKSKPPSEFGNFIIKYTNFLICSRNERECSIDDIKLLAKSACSGMEDSFSRLESDFDRILFGICVSFFSIFDRSHDLKPRSLRWTLGLYLDQPFSVPARTVPSGAKFVGDRLRGALSLLSPQSFFAKALNGEGN